MNLYGSQYKGQLIPSGPYSVPAPSALIEYGFYFYMFYTLLGGVFGLFVNNLASGLLVMLVLISLYEVGFHAITVIKLIAFPLGCGIAYAFIQLVVFDESLTEAIRPFLIWMIILFLVQLLSFRTRFLHRFVLVMFFIGLAAVPYIKVYESSTLTGTMQRIHLDRAIGFHSTNTMAEWYGFCAVYFMLLGWTVGTNTARNLSWLTAVVCLYVVTLTVSRATLMAIVIAMIVSSRGLLRQGFVPLLMAAFLAWIVFELGIFDQTAQYYVARGTEETGRLAVWPLIIESFLDSPVIGVGHSHVGAMTARGSFVTPHNSFLYIAQSSGIVPLIFFVGCWVRAGLAALRAGVSKSPEAMFYLPLFVFSFLVVNAGNLTFMEIAVVVSLTLPIAGSVQWAVPDSSSRVKRGRKLQDSRGRSTISTKMYDC